MIALVDYGAGNLTSVRKALAAIGAERLDADRRPASSGARHGIIVPGVGHFDCDARARRQTGARAIRRTVADGTPLLGICVGLQWLFEGSVEAPDVDGLGVFKGRCSHLRTASPQALKPQAL